MPDQIIPLFDTHAHYDHPQFKNNGPNIVKQLFEDKIISAVVIPAITYGSNFCRDMFPAEDFPNVYFAAGLHPKSAVNEQYWSDEKCAEFISLLRDPRTVAVKTGLDFSKQTTDKQKERQIYFFRLMIEFANAERLPLVLHVRNAYLEAADVLKEQELKVEAVLHCFTADMATSERLMSAGVTRFGIGGMLTRDGMDDLRECVKELPLSTLLLETDSPYVRPEGYPESVNTSRSLPMVVSYLAKLKGVSEHEIAEVTRKNAEEFYGI